MRRILFVSCNYASDYGPMVWGTYIRMRMLLEAAVRAAEAVDLLLFADADLLPAVRPLAVAASLRTHWGIDVTVHVAARSRAAHGGHLSTLRSLFDIRYQQDYGDAGGVAQARAVATTIEPDTELVIAHRLDAALAVVAGARLRASGRVPVAINFDDIEHVARARRTERSKASLDTVLRRLGIGAIRRAERDMVDAAQSALVCSREERAHLVALGVATPITVIHNAVAFPPPVERHPTTGRTIMFIGSYGYEPNIEAAEELINAIFPLILVEVPDARLLIAGARSERLPSAATTHQGVEILGFIDDVSAIYARADVACCAIRAGGGTRIKIIEAAAWAVPTVSTALGAEGLDLVDGSEIALAESVRAIADACIRLLQAPQLAVAMGAAARRKVARDYERGIVIERLVESYRETAGFAATGTSSEERA